MDSKLLSFALISILIGGLLGAGASYILYNDRISDTESALNTMALSINSIESSISTIVEDVSEINENIDKISSDIAVLEDDSLEQKDSITSIRNSQKELSEKLLDLTEIERGRAKDWQEVYSLTSFSPDINETFYSNGNQLILRWTAIGTTPESQLTIYLYYGNGTYYGLRTITGVFVSTTADILLEEAGRYYIEVEEKDIYFWAIYIKDYY